MRLLMLMLFGLTLTSRAATPPGVNPRSLPPHWFVRDASEFAKLGITAQTLVLEPRADQPPVATVQVMTKTIKHPLGDDPKEWTRAIVTSPEGGWSFKGEPYLQRRAGLRVYRAEMRSDSNSQWPHHLAVAAIEYRGHLLLLFTRQTQAAHLRQIEAVRDLYDHVLPER